MTLMQWYWECSPINAIKEELASFAQSIEQDTSPLVTIEDGYHALEVALKIMDKINSSNGLG